MIDSDEISLSASSKPTNQISGLFDMNKVLSTFKTNMEFWTQKEQKDKLFKVSENQKKIETHLLMSIWENVLCPLRVNIGVDYYHSRIDGQQLRLMASKHFYDPQVMSKIQCLVGSLAIMPNQQLLGASAGQRVRYWLANRKWLASGAYGSVSTANFDGATNIIAIKVATDVEDLTHELFVGFHLNALRSEIPNFAYVYAGFDCNYPLNTKEMRGWCHNTDNKLKRISTILYENISPSETLYDYLKGGATFDQWLNIYLQFLFAIRLAYNKYNFTHYDIHLKNILIRRIEGVKPFYIPYTSDVGIEYLLADKIATIIDYGFSHIKIGTNVVGVYNVRGFGIDPLRGRPMADAYRFLMTTFQFWYGRRDLNKVNNIVPLLRFFWKNVDKNTVNVMATVLSNLTHMELPELSELKTVTIDKLLNYIRSNYKLDVMLTKNKPSSVRILGCSGTDICLASNSDYDAIGLNPKYKPEKLFEFYDLHRYLINIKSSGLANDLKSIYKDKYLLYYPITLGNYNSVLTQATKIIGAKTIDWKNIQNTDITALGSSQQLADEYKKQLTIYLVYYDILWNGSNLRNILMYAANVYGNTSENFSRGKKILLIMKKLLEKIKLLINNDWDHIKYLSSNATFRRSKNFEFWGQLGNFLNMIPFPQIQ